MRAAVLISGLVGALAGIAGDQLLRSHDGEPAPLREAAAHDALSGRFEQCVARLDAIDAQLARIAAAPAAPVRTEEGEAIAPKLEERLAAIESSLHGLGDRLAGTATKADDPPRRTKDVAVIQRLFEAEYARRNERRNDHQGYSADRLYDRYGAPDHIWADPKDAQKKMYWTYDDPNGMRGVVFTMSDGLVVEEGAWQK